MRINGLQLTRHSLAESNRGRILAAQAPADALAVSTVGGSSTPTRCDGMGGRSWTS